MVSRKDLYQLVWTEPMIKIAELFEVSGSYLARMCTMLDVPRPERGYWAKLAVGKAPPKPCLPAPGPATLMHWSRDGEPVASPRSRPTLEPRPRAQVKVRIARDRVHGLIHGAATHFRKSRPVKDGGYLKPFKKLLIDVTASPPCLDRALDLANDLFNVLDSVGHRVLLAATHMKLSRIRVEEREIAARPRDAWQYDGLWSPYQPTVVFVGTVAIGLQVVEMSENIDVRYVDGKFVRASDYVAPKWRNFVGDDWTTKKDVPSGRLRIVAYSPYSEVQWSVQWQETRTAGVKSRLPSIVDAIEAAAPEIVVKLAEADRKAEIRRLDWLATEDRRKRDEDRRRIEQSATESAADLRQVIERWADRTSIERFLEEVERRATGLSESEREAVLQRLDLARAFLGTADPLDFFRAWRTPVERYIPRYAEDAQAVVSTMEPETASTKSSANEEANMVTKPSRFRSIVYRFFRRSLSEKNEIVGALRLVDDEDTKLIDVERFKLQLMRAKERNQLDALEEMISRIEVGS